MTGNIYTAVLRVEAGGGAGYSNDFKLGYSPPCFDKVVDSPHGLCLSHLYTPECFRHQNIIFDGKFIVEETAA